MKKGDKTVDLFYIQLAAVIDAIIFGSISIFQVLLAAGLPLGKVAWGGNHRILPVNLRIASAVSPILLIGGSILILHQARIISLNLDPLLAGTLIWIFTVLTGFTVLLNIFSKSKIERLIMTPLAGIGFLSCLFVAIFS